MNAQTIGYLGTALVVVTYLLATRWKRMLVFHWGNALGAFPLLYSGIVIGAWPQAVVTFFFGAIGWWGLAQHYWGKS